MLTSDSEKPRRLPPDFDWQPGDGSQRRFGAYLALASAAVVVAAAFIGCSLAGL